MNSLLHWFSMGGYGVYVWAAYGLAASVLLGNLIVCQRKKVETHKRLHQWLKGSQQ
ncbi:heme exporter protein CcmD [Legionella impletisoli]|uniref:Heme exporter protein D n=1 Tax=Legionella impletisoli TaxID=343510 RepID=A0A917JNE3_9GAMM|nr:heme exporter protein CcmD [Legionella impletisoli]GGI78752.1 hypothetical protein GCM10007966_04200 [Legionella impletisoli]